ncbi:MAG TPA: dNTP triphosphohydrolase [Candidatus Acidoferrales bacterium]|nr:dNTP triphosphohydrolase [Candidatus Acidoferrales bacterium]
MAQEDVPRGDDRNDFQRDRDIILYTSAFKRLSGITQVVSPHTGHVFHNRLTHTLQVAQVGRSLAEKLHIHYADLAGQLGIDPQAVEAGCLAHDLGHPPFGHVAEQTLNKLVGEDGFEGNAQSFRIVSELAFRSLDFSGLNLTKATLRAILKYPWVYETRPIDKSTGEKSKKWGAYGSELTPFSFATDNSDGGPVARAAEAELMDWADDLTYSVHDVEDFYRAGLIPLNQLRPQGKPGLPEVERERFITYVYSRRSRISELAYVEKPELISIFDNLLFSYFTIDGAYEGTRDQRARLRSFTGQLVNRYINGLGLLRRDDGSIGVEINPGYKREIAILKQLTWLYVIEAPSLSLQQHSQRQIIGYLYRVFMQETRQSPSRLLPPYYRERLQDVLAKEGGKDLGRKRIVADLIAGMTEDQAVAVYQRLNGIVVGSGLDNLLG